MTQDIELNFFLSHASADKSIVRDFGVELQLFGVDVFFDEWSIEIGESIPGAIDKALDSYQVFVLFWSHEAYASNWVRREYQSAVKAFIEDDSRRLIIATLDDCPVPALISDLKWFDLEHGDVRGLIEAVMGFRGEHDRVRAIQRYLESLHIDVRYFEGYGAAVGCPRCGAGVDSLRPFRQWHGDDEYGGVECAKCPWNDGGEL